MCPAPAIPAGERELHQPPPLNEEKRCRMAKWADYCIFQVRYDEHHRHIDRVRAYPDLEDSLGAAVDFLRTQVIAAIKQGTTFITVFRGSDSKWTRGQVVKIIHVNGTEYIKTIDNGREEDNLENLPEY